MAALREELGEMRPHFDAPNTTCSGHLAYIGRPLTYRVLRSILSRRDWGVIVAPKADCISGLCEARSDQMQPDGPIPSPTPYHPLLPSYFRD